MARINTRDDLKDYALRALGHPVISINVDDAQLEDRLDEALQDFAAKHSDGTQRLPLRYQLTQTDIDNKYILKNDIAPNIVSITKIFPLNDSTMGIFDVRYQMHMNDIFGLRSGNVDLTTYDIAKTYLNLINQFLSPEKFVRFSTVSDKIFIDMDWTSQRVGNYIYVDAFVAFDPETYTDIYNDRFLKRYVIELFRKQWGENLSKFGGVLLMGGVTFTGEGMIERADAAIEKLKKELDDEYQLPVDFMIG